MNCLWISIELQSFEDFYLKGSIFLISNGLKRLLLEVLESWHRRLSIRNRISLRCISNWNFQWILMIRSDECSPKDFLSILCYFVTLHRGESSWLIADGYSRSFITLCRRNVSSAPEIGLQKRPRPSIWKSSLGSMISSDSYSLS